MTKRRKYTPEFKREAVALAQQPGMSCRQIALDIGINPNLLSRWKREAERSSEQAFKGSGSPRDEEVARLKRELAKVKKERDLSRKLFCSADVPLSESVTKWLLRLVRPKIKPTCAC